MGEAAGQIYLGLEYAQSFTVSITRSWSKSVMNMSCQLRATNTVSDSIMAELQALRELNIEELAAVDVDTTNCYVKGFVATTYPSFNTGIRKTKKIVIKSHDPQQFPATTAGMHAVMVFLMGENVEICDVLKESDTVIIKGFKLEKSSNPSCPVQMVVNLQNIKNKIWILQDKNMAALSPKELCSSGKAGFSDNSGSSYLKDSHKSPDKSIQISVKSDKSSNLPKQCHTLVSGSKLLRIPVSSSKPVLYTKLSDLKENRSANIFAIVKFFKRPEKSKGHDFCLSLSLVDDSFQSTDQSFQCNIFAHRLEMLPGILNVGDIVRFEGIQLSRFRHNIQGKGTSSLAWLTFDGFPNTPIIPSASSSSYYTLSEENKKSVQNLKSWASQHPSIMPQQLKKTLSQIKRNITFLNLGCQVVSICKTTQTNCLALTVWDGTIPFSSSFCLEKQDADTLVTSEQLGKDSQGMTVDVLLYDEHSCGSADTLKPGDFVMLNNLHMIVEKEANQKVDGPTIVSLVMHKGGINGRGVRKLPQDHFLTKEVQEQIKSTKDDANNEQQTVTEPQQTTHSTNNKATSSSRTSKEQQMVTEPQQVSHSTNNKATSSSRTSKEQQNVTEPQQTTHSTNNKATSSSRTLQTSCTITAFPCVPFTSIEKVRQCATVPKKFRCRVKVMAFLPDNVEDFVQRCCQGCRKVYQVNTVTPDREQSMNVEDSYSESQSQCSTPMPNSSTGTTSKNCQGNDTEDDSQDIVQGADKDHGVNICSACQQPTSLVYVFSLLIEDPTGILHVMLFDEDAKEYFDELPAAEEFLKSTETQQGIRQSLVMLTNNQSNELTAESPSDGNRPWLECCVASYTNNKSVLYRMFGTTLV